MSFETTITVPTRDLARLTRLLTRAGGIVLDRGERTTTEDGVGAEATLNVVFVTETDVTIEALGISR